MDLVLHLTLKKKWFDMIASGEKKEEYRELKEYWHRRFSNHWCKAVKKLGGGGIKEYSTVIFKNGYQKESPIMEVEVKGIEKGTGNIGWGAPNFPVYIIKLGKIISIHNYAPSGQEKQS